MKYFIITVDTEGDNLWDYHEGDIITTHNSSYIPRFQELCNNYGFFPVYLTNYEMLNDEPFVNNLKAWSNNNLCEVGLHLHAWNNPPYFRLDNCFDGNSYLIEYPDEIMKQKFGVLYNLFVQKLGFKPFSHRAGRWAMDMRYYNILREFDIRVDCSVTPGINWQSSKGKTIDGPDYSHSLATPSYINGVMEVPVSVQKIHHCSEGTLKHRIRTLLFGDNIWLRPASQSVKMMKRLIDINSKSQCDYVEFMIHSSELMPGGSPYFKDTDAVEKLYQKMDMVFAYAKESGYQGITLQKYYENKCFGISL